MPTLTLIPQPKQRLSKYRPEPKRAPGLVLTPRDRQLLRAVHDFRILSSKQLLTLFSPDGREPAHPLLPHAFGDDTALNRRLQKLFHHRYFDRLFLPTVLGSSPALYILTKQGADLVAADLDIPVREVNYQQKTKEIKPLFLEHTLAINDVRIAFAVAARRHPGHQILQWVDEKGCRHRYSYWDKKQNKEIKETFNPDGFVRFLIGAPPESDEEHEGDGQGRQFGWFIEVDLATEESKRWKAKVQRYLSYTESGRYQDVYGLRRYRVLVVTTSPQRLQNLKKTTEQADGVKVFWFTTRGELSPETILDQPIWYRAGEMERRRLLTERLA